MAVTGADGNAVQSAGNATATAPFSLTDPSTWASIMPDWTGDVQAVGAEVSGAVQGTTSIVASTASTVYDATVDPVVKSAESIASGTASAIGSGISSAASATKSAVTGVFSFISTPIEWAIFALVIGAALYFAAPILLARRP